MLRSMFSGISGMKNFQTKLDVIGNNIANVNTAGFKKGRVTFKDSMNQMVAGASAATENRGGKNAMQVGLGSTLATIDTIHTGSSLQTTNRPLDLGIDGDGYFVVKQGDAQFYTRAGNFYLDDYGTLVTADGLKVQAYKYAADGKTLTNTYGDVAVNVNAVLPPVTTKTVMVSENLAANANGGTTFKQTIRVIDKDGNPQSVDITFKKHGTTTNLWNVFVNTDPDASPTPASLALTFNANGTLATQTPDKNTNFTVDVLGNGAGTDDLPIKFDFSSITQLNGSTTALVKPDGNTEGKLESFSVGMSGDISGIYSNGQILTLGRLALAKFSNSSGLLKSGNNTFQESINSGAANIGAAGDGRGVIASGTLEMSNVDLSEEFTEMITAQRGFQANTRIITTSDEILQELVNLKR
ncbi:flagellar hook protein FlgE [Bacillus sp. 31A1R]|uniref:Flagellar hook protein FlgE n=1 Tax=Robertmurraya mangrovi TaxID=3098077 RepID=A0ABU5J299_9BACI|nr:flagellar hook protein FlgE [Bacillus sp. 31A1R]MDZ5473476.1 flagellar hook protein FlgE [Bacillus sp. 31A1R]